MKDNHSPEVVVIIVNYKTSHLIQGLLDSIQEDTTKISVIVLDNGSTEESYSPLTAINDERLILARSEQNLGFAGGVNFALNYMADLFPSVNYFFLLNPDALCSPNAIYCLLNILKTQSNAACVSPQIINEDGTPGYSGGMINYKKGEVTITTYANASDAGAVYEVDVFTGCAALLDFKKAKEVGFFNESLFMYFDEAEMSLKLRKLGYKILYTPMHKVFHDHSYTTRNTSYVKTYYMSRNRFKVFHAEMPFWHKLYFCVHEFAYHLKHKRTKNAFYHLKGIYHYYTMKMGNGFDA
jgi:GT2 family glycosyltransferase